MLQCLERCRQEVCEKLKLQPSDIELSMGMSQDYEQAVCCTKSQAADCDDLQAGGVLSAAALLHTNEDPWMCEQCGLSNVVCIDPDDDLGLIWACSAIDCVQIEMGSTNVRVGSTIFGARDYAKWTERPRDKEQEPADSDSN